jgi:hydroxycarboxylate dehydrogenase B
MTKIIEHTKLRRVVEAICVAAGSEGDEPALVSENLVNANLMGHDSHGVGMIPRYISCVLTGALQPNAHAKMVVDSGALVVMDGQAGFGQVIGGEIMDVGIERAREHGVAIVATRNSFHLCRIGAWAERCAHAGFVSMHHTNVVGHGPAVAPYGGAEARYSTNPYTVGIPATDNQPMTVLDMATSVVAMGKVRVARNKGDQVAEGILLDSDGQNTTDPNVMYEEPKGAVKPFGGHKGGGLALINELLAGCMSGGQTLRPETVAGRNTTLNNMLSIIIDPTKLVTESFFKSEIDATLDYIKATRPIDPDKPVLVPGDPERLMRAEREANGVPVDDATWTDILAAAKSVGLGDNTIEEIAS